MTLLCIEPIRGDTYETAGYVRCEWCGETACEDIWAGHLDESGWRLFFEIVGEGLVVCSCCLEGGLVLEELNP